MRRREDVTPAACEKALQQGLFSRALLLALRLNSAPLLRLCIDRTPPAAVAASAAAAPAVYLPRTLAALADAAEASPHLEHTLAWLKAVFAAHGRNLQERQGEVAPVMAQLARALARVHDDLAATAGANLYALARAGRDGIFCLFCRKDAMSMRGRTKVY